MKKKKKKFPVKITLILSASALLLVGSTIGSTRAALTYYSDNYSAQVNMDNIGVTLLENGEAVSFNNYGEDDNKTEGKLLSNLLGEDKKIAPGKKYDERLSVQNTGNIDTFVRVVLTKSWKDKDGNKNTALAPELIDLNVLSQNGWEQAEVQSSPERIVLYYTNILPAGEISKDLTDTIRIDSEIVNAKYVSKVTEGNTIRYIYDYDGYTFSIDAEVNAVQTHNAAEAIKSAWGVDATISPDETSYSLQ